VTPAEDDFAAQFRLEICRAMKRHRDVRFVFSDDRPGYVEITPVGMMPTFWADFCHTPGRTYCGGEIARVLDEWVGRARRMVVQP